MSILDRSVDYCAAALKAAPYPFLLLDRALTVVEANDVYLRTAGRPREWVIGRYIFNIFPVDPTQPESSQQRTIHESFKKVLATGEADHIASLRYAIPKLTPDGPVLEDRYWNIVNTPICNGDGQVDFILHTPIEVTELFGLRKALGSAHVDYDFGLLAASGLINQGRLLEEANRKLEAERARLRRVFDQAPGMTAILQGPELVYEVVNRAYRNGLRGQKLLGRPYKEAHPELKNQGFFEDLDTVMISGEAVVGRQRRVLLQDVDGGGLNEAYIDFVFQPLFAPDSTVSGIFIQANDVTTKVRAKRALERSNERWQLAVQDARDGVWEWNPQTNDIIFSRRWKEMLGYDAREIANGMSEWESRVHPDDYPNFAHALHAGIEGRPFHSEHRLRCKDGTWKWVLARAVVVDECEAGPTRMTGTLSDISQKKEWEEQIWRHANFDTLTGLPNRRLFRKHLQQALEQDAQTNIRLAVMYIDLDYFKQVNDLLGHDAGDFLLALAGRRIAACTKEGDFLARVGGDEFFLLIPGVADTSVLDTIAKDILQELTTPFRLESEVAHVSASIGVTLYPDDATTSEGLIRNADQAMYAAKRSGRNQVHFFTASMRDEAQRRVQLGRDLRLAIAGRQLEVHYQPIVHLASGKILKAEALLRWNHPEFGRVPSSLFIPIAEETGLINEIGDWVMNEVASWLSGWMKRTGHALQVSVNCSPVQLLASGSIKAMLRTAESFHLPPNSIVLEITEGVLLNATPVVADALLQCRDAGIQVALDDFGTGYSSMAYLKKFDIDFLKIDRSFIQDLETAPGSLAIAESIVMMAHRLDMKVIAEGIETAGQREILVRAGCDLAQGYLFSKPVPAGAFERLVENAIGR